METPAELKERIAKAMEQVIDPEIKRPITELNMLKSIQVDADYQVVVELLLTVVGCPLKDVIELRVKKVLQQFPSITNIKINMGVMDEAERSALRKKLRGGQDEPIIPFAQPNNRTKVFAIASGKGGVGKSSITVNLAAAAASQGLNVGIIDADIYGHSIPTLLGSHTLPTKLDNMIIPPVTHNIKHISIDQFTTGNTPVVWRGPMLHRALQQFLIDVYWGDLDILLLDLPPGTGDIALSVAQLLPNSELIIVTTPQVAATSIAERAGSISIKTKQRIAGVIENMAGYTLPNGTVVDIFGSGGGQAVADNLTRLLGSKIPLLGTLTLDPQFRISGDEGVPEFINNPTSVNSQTLLDITNTLLAKTSGIVGMSLGLDSVKAKKY